ncbi:hypothetical protein J2N69_35890 [Streptomyces huasconensis]|uniref:hypothetical protein n=1 Tax=Streptomyces huasconensis TaxID=1854574 RepID=UPI001E2E533E|nr:hypothetical protein [Streptomyces huasconensis]UFQ19913.1 hypothetical protein J2N69_35890 [Streptomyces huasconensis]
MSPKVDHRPNCAGPFVGGHDRQAIPKQCERQQNRNGRGDQPGAHSVPDSEVGDGSRDDEQVPVEQADEEVDAHPGVVGLLARHVGYSGVEFVPKHLRDESVAVIAILLEPSDRFAEPSWG